MVNGLRRGWRYGVYTHTHTLCMKTWPKGVYGSEFLHHHYHTAWAFYGVGSPSTVYTTATTLELGHCFTEMLKLDW